MQSGEQQCISYEILTPYIEAVGILLYQVIQEMKYIYGKIGVFSFVVESGRKIGVKLGVNVKK